jgi:hypothetical protein
MSERRTLIEGVKAPVPTDPAREEQFVYGKSGVPPAAETTPAVPNQTGTARQGRSPISTRIRSDLAEALKRASLERQLKGTRPHTVQDILETALEPWLKEQGYLE